MAFEGLHGESVRPEQGFGGCVETGQAEGKWEDTIIQEESERLAWEVMWDFFFRPIVPWLPALNTAWRAEIRRVLPKSTSLS